VAGNGNAGGGGSDTCVYGSGREDMRADNGGGKWSETNTVGHGYSHPKNGLMSLRDKKTILSLSLPFF
ncbi:hypothetical protein Tco_0108038, partial [Tanacetum coccineum]